MDLSSVENAEWRLVLGPPMVAANRSWQPRVGKIKLGNKES